MKKILSLLMTVLMLLSVIPFSVSAATAGANGLTYDWYIPNTTKGGAEVIGYSAGDEALGDYVKPQNIEIPEKFLFTEIVSIRTKAFYNQERPITATMPNTVFNIGDKAFMGYINLKGITLSTGLTNLGTSAFEGCTSLKSIDIPNGITTVKPYTFSGCSSLENVTLPYSVSIIDVRAFEDCTSLYTISLPSNLYRINHAAFSGCTSLSKIRIPSSVTSIDSFAFSDCKSLSSVTITEKVKNIGDSVFIGCSNLTDVYYSGSQEEWESLGVDVGKATVHYYNCPSSMLAHSYGESAVTEVGTCLNPEIIKSTCKNCKYVRIEYGSTDPNNHVHGSWEITKDARCTEKGERQYICDCGNYSVYEDLAALSHKYYSSLTEATCTSGGYYTYTCIRCPDSYIASASGPLGHTIDTNGICKTCKYDATENCGHTCHKGGFFYKMALFFWKLFKMNRECACGIYHY